MTKAEATALLLAAGTLGSELLADDIHADLVEAAWVLADSAHERATLMRFLERAAKPSVARWNNDHAVAAYICNVRIERLRLEATSR